jgi:hypothetical protein
MMSKTHYFTISNVKDMLAATLSSPGEMGVFFSAAEASNRGAISIGA